MKLKPCKDYAYEQGSIFLAEVKILDKKKIEKEMANT